MKLSNNGHAFKKKILNKNFIIPFFIILIILVTAYLMRYYNVSSSSSKTNDEITEIVRYTLGEYLGEYGISEVTVNTLEKEIAAVGSESITSLSKEDQQAIINSVVGILEPEFYRKISLNSEDIRQQTLTELETRLNQSITETVDNKLSETVVLTEEQKQLLVDNTAVIVETKIMEKLREDIEKNMDVVTLLEQKIQNNLTKIESTLNTYEAKLKSMESTINELKAVTNQMNVDSAGNVTNMENQISILQSGYDSFRKEYVAHVANALTVSNIIADLSVYPQSDEGVLSAQTGYQIYVELKSFQKKMQDDLSQMGVDINENIMAQINNIESDINQLQKSTTDNYEELKKTSATKAELVGAQTSLSQSLELTNQNLSNLDTLTTEKLKETKDTLDQAITNMGDKAGQDLIEARDTLQLAIDNNTTDTVALQTALNNALTAISNNKMTVDNQLQSINQDISNINNSITGVRSEVENLKDSQVVFEWSSDENGATLKIITP